MRDPARVIKDFVAPLDADGPYRAPTSAERASAVRGLRQALAGDGASLAAHGFGVEIGTDPVTGRDHAMLRSELGGERAWGLFVIDRCAPIGLLIGVPHPNSDLRTEDTGIALFRRIPGSLLLVAGAHRRAAGHAADVAHRADSMFHAVCADLGLPQIQLHGFGNGTLPGHDVVVSSGPAAAGAGVRRVADRLVDAGFATCRAWEQDCAGLSGSTNVQGLAAAAAGTVFVHLEMNRSLRYDAAGQAAVVDALVAADVGA